MQPSAARAHEVASQVPVSDADHARPARHFGCKGMLARGDLGLDCFPSPLRSATTGAILSVVNALLAVVLLLLRTSRTTDVPHASGEINVSHLSMCKCKASIEYSRPSLPRDNVAAQGSFDPECGGNRLRSVVSNARDRGDSVSSARMLRSDLS